MTVKGAKAIRGAWVLAIENEKPALVRDAYVVIEGNTIAGVSHDLPKGCDLISEGEQHLVLPGLINMHNHCIASTPFRGLSEDMPVDTSDEFPAELVYGLLMPMADKLVASLSRDEARAVLKLGLLEVIKGGSTSLMEVFRIGHSQLMQHAADMGLRLFAMPYLFSASDFGIAEDGSPVFDQRSDDLSMLDDWKQLYAAHDNTADGRVRVGLGPHGSDTCGPEMLRAIRAAADERGCKITIHLSQTQAEEDLAQERYGMSATRYLDSIGLLGPDLVAAHCLFVSESDLALMSERGVTVVNCPLTFARGGVFAPFHRFKDAGLRTVIGTDGYCMDIVGEMRSAGFMSKLHAASPRKTSAWELVDAVTTQAAGFLGRGDLGRIEAGAAADLVVIDLNKPHFQPVSDPIKTFLWNASRADVHTVMVDGRILVGEGRYLLGDEAAIIRDGATAIERVWDEVKAAGTVKPHFFEGL